MARSRNSFPTARPHRRRSGGSVRSRQTLAGGTDAHFPEFDAYRERHPVGTPRPESVSAWAPKICSSSNVCSDQTPRWAPAHSRHHQLRAGQGSLRQFGAAMGETALIGDLIRLSAANESQRRAHHFRAGSAPLLVDRPPEEAPSTAAEEPCPSLSGIVEGKFHPDRTHARGRRCHSAVGRLGSLPGT